MSLEVVEVKYKCLRCGKEFRSKEEFKNHECTGTD